MYRFILVMFLCTAHAFGQALIITEENDAFTGSDNDYSQGLEITYEQQVDRAKNNKPYRISWGAKNLIYTPTVLSNPFPQPGDRPWGGITMVTRTKTTQTSRTIENEYISVGASGDWSFSDVIQTEWHALLGITEPLGWDNQIANEIVANYKRHYIKPLAEAGNRKETSADIAAAYGFVVGTANVNSEAGLYGRAGWNMPRQRLSLINTTSRTFKPSAFLFARGRGTYHLHNIMINGSLFQDGPERDLEHLVFDGQVGLSVGATGIGDTNTLLTYSYTYRTKEFRGQSNDVDFGTIELRVGKSF